MSAPELEAAAKRKDASYPVVFERARRLEAGGKFGEAGSEYLRAIEIDPVKRDAWVGVGRAKFSAGQWNQAEQALRKTIEQWPDAAEPRVILAGLLASTFRLKEARWQLKEGLRLDPTIRESWLALGQLEMKLDNPGGAVDAFMHARKLGSDSPASHRAYGTALLAAGRPKEARKELEAALKGDPSDLDARLQHGRSIILGGLPGERIEGMKELARTAEFSTNKAPAFMETARVWAKDGNLGDATQALEHAVDADPNNVEALQMLVDSYRKAGNGKQAERFSARLKALRQLSTERESVRAALNDGKDVVPNLERLGQLSADLGDLPESRSAFGAAVALDPACTKAKDGLRALDKRRARQQSSDKPM
jgi:cytochrome c-type biogenesis protein CcmH/NrfG